MSRSFRTVSALWKARALFAHPRKLLRVFRDSRTPLMARVLPILALVYIFFPLDIVPDFIPFLGQIDDVSIALYLVSYALTLIPEEVFKSVGLYSTVHDVS